MSSDSIDIKKLWHQQQIAPLNMDALHAMIKQFKRGNLRRLILTNAALVLTCVVVIVIWYFARPQFITTQIGIVLLVLAMVMFVLVSNRQFFVLADIDTSKACKTYMNNLLRLKERQKFAQTTVLSLYFVLLSAGIGLYMYEFALQMSIGMAVLAYALTGGWIIFNWLYIRPKTIRKQAAKLDKLIEDVAGIDKQWTAEDNVEI